VVGTAIELGRHLGENRDQVDVAEVVDDLNRQSIELLSSFPSIADSYEDLDRFDAWLQSERNLPGLAGSFDRYLEWLGCFVEGIVRRMVMYATSSESTELSPERVARFLERFDAVLDEVFERWLLDATLHPEPERDGGGWGADGEGAGRDR